MKEKGLWVYVKWSEEDGAYIAMTAHKKIFLSEDGLSRHEAIRNLADVFRFAEPELTRALKVKKKKKNRRKK